MSLIHQALKKVEAIKQGYDAPEEFSRPGGSAWPSVFGRVFLLGLLSVLSLSAGVAFYYFSSFEGVKTAPKINVAERIKKVGAADAPEASPSEKAMGLNANGMELYGSGRYMEARAEFKAAIKFTPESPYLYNNIGITEMALNNLGEAEEHYKKAVSLKPDYTEAINNYGALFDKKGEPFKAIEHFNKAILINPSYADPHLNLAIALERLGKIDEAVFQYETYLGLNPGGPLSERIGRKAARLRSAAALKQAEKASR